MTEASELLFGLDLGGEGAQVTQSRHPLHPDQSWACSRQGTHRGGAMGVPMLRHRAVCAKALGRGVVWMRDTQNLGQLRPRGRGRGVE